MINSSPALKNSPEIINQPVCVAEEDSVCGEKRATISDFLGAVTRISAENIVGKR